jgi:hypothetical protein
MTLPFLITAIGTDFLLDGKEKYNLDTSTATEISPNCHLKCVPQEEPEADRRTPDLL